MIGLHTVFVSMLASECVHEIVDRRHNKYTNTLVHEKEYRFPISYVELDESVYGLLVLLLENDLAIDEKVNFRESTHITRTARIIDIAQKMIARLPDYQRHGSTYTSTAIWLCSEANTVLSH